MQSRARAGFTLIELMVSMALTLVIMTILSQAFVLALDTFSGLKGLGDMQMNLRTASVLLKNDFGNDHFEGNRRLSDSTIVNQNTPPLAGFFAVVQSTPASAVAGSPYYVEGVDQNGMNSFRAVNHLLYFTVKRKGNRQENFFSTVMQDVSVPPTSPSPALNTFFSVQTAFNTPAALLANVTLTNPYPPLAGMPQNQAFYSSQWAEVVYYLVATGTSTDPTNPNTIPTYSLYRAEFVMPPDSSKLSGILANTQINPFLGLSCNITTASPTLVTFNSPTDAALGQRTINLSAVDFTRLAACSTLVLPNVISFQVQIMPTGGGSFVDVPSVLYDTTLFNNGVYTNNFGLRGIQVTMRVWDAATRQTRQATVIQDL